MAEIMIDGQDRPLAEGEGGTQGCPRVDASQAMRYPKKPEPPPVFVQRPADWRSWTREQKRVWVRELIRRD